MREIKVVIGTDGSAKMEANGFTGGVCESTLNELLVAVGGTEESQTEKPEYFDLRTFINPSMDAVTKLVEDKIENVFCCANKG